MSVTIEINRTYNHLYPAERKITIDCWAEVEVDVVDRLDYEFKYTPSEDEVTVESADTTIVVYVENVEVFSLDTTDLEVFHSVFKRDDWWQKAEDSYYAA